MPSKHISRPPRKLLCQRREEEEDEDLEERREEDDEEEPGLRRALRSFGGRVRMGGSSNGITSDADVAESRRPGVDPRSDMDDMPG